VGTAPTGLHACLMGEHHSCCCRWSEERLHYVNDAYIRSALEDRLDHALEENITVITAAGLGLPSTRESNGR
jgi:hypothetical protein